MKVFLFTNGPPQAWQEAVQTLYQIKPDKACHSQQGLWPDFPNCLVQGSRGPAGGDNKGLFLLMRIIYHHYINLINATRPVQREEITGH